MFTAIPRTLTQGDQYINLQDGLVKGYNEGLQTKDITVSDLRREYRENAPRGGIIGFFIDGSPHRMAVRSAIKEVFAEKGIPLEDVPAEEAGEDRAGKGWALF